MPPSIAAINNNVFFVFIVFSVFSWFRFAKIGLLFRTAQSFHLFFYTKLHIITKASVSSDVASMFFTRSPYSNHRLLGLNGFIICVYLSHPWSIINCQLSLVNCHLSTVNCHLSINFRFLPFSMYIPFGNPEPFVTRRPERSKLCSFEGLTSTDSVGVMAWVLSVE